MGTQSTFFELGKDKAAKGEGWAPPFISCAQDSAGHLPPLPLRLLGFGRPLPFYVVLALPGLESACAEALSGQTRACRDSVSSEVSGKEKYTAQMSLGLFTYTVELQWLKQAWNHENWFQSKVVPASQGKFL